MQAKDSKRAAIGEIGSAFEILTGIQTATDDQPHVLLPNSYRFRIPANRRSVKMKSITRVEALTQRGSVQKAKTR